MKTNKQTNKQTIVLLLAVIMFMFVSGCDNSSPGTRLALEDDLLHVNKAPCELLLDVADLVSPKDYTRYQQMDHLLITWNYNSDVSTHCYDSVPLNG